MVEEVPMRVYWRTSLFNELSYHDATTMQDAKHMKRELEKEGYIVEMIVKGSEKGEKI